MIREEGYYWVKFKSATDWEIAEYFEYHWRVIGDNKAYKEGNIEKVGERIERTETVILRDLSKEELKKEILQLLDKDKRVLLSKIMVVNEIIDIVKADIEKEMEKEGLCQ